jgi:hypothetical protein
MALNDIIFQKQNGGMGRTAANEDVVSGLLMGLSGITSTDLGKFDTITVTGTNGYTLYIAKIDYYEQLKMQYGIEETEKEKIEETVGTIEGQETQDQANTRVRNSLYAQNAIVYHVREFFRMSPTGKLYLAIRESVSIGGDEIELLQYYSVGKIRQMGIFTDTFTNLAGYQTACTGLEQEHQPLSLIVTRKRKKESKDETLSDLVAATTSVLAGQCNVSILIGCDLNPDLIALLGSTYSTYGCIGNCLGAVSKAAVNESIAWVQKFPLGLSMPGFITGDLVKEVATANLNLLNDKRYIFVRTHVGISDCYYNDSFTLDLPTSDYAYIENVRTMDKATRGIRTNLLPYLNSPLYVDAETGKLRADTVAVLETIAGNALDDMEKAGELSGYKVEINPEQNVLATSELEVQIKNVAVGVMRKVVIKIGFTTAID